MFQYVAIIMYMTVSDNCFIIDGSMKKRQIEIKIEMFWSILMFQHNTSKRWKEVTSNNEVIEFAAQKEIKWSFITDCAPWSGDVYDIFKNCFRFVGIFKNCFRGAVGKKLLNFDDFQTTVAEIEAVINARPLT